MKEKVVLAFSGGLDTTYCVKYLSEEKGLEVHSAVVNTGGFDQAELHAIEKRAYELGVASHKTLDATRDFYERCVRYLIFGNVLKNNTYPLSVSAERAFQAVAIGQYAKEVQAAYIAHGSTGAGNDQVRFDMIFHILYPDVQILTPIRDQQLSRQQEIDYLKNQGVERDWSQSLYSINKGLWGTSVGGKETLTSDQYLPEEAWPTPISKTKAEELSLTFEQGEPVALNGTEYRHPVELIQALEQQAAPFGIGRDVHVGDTVIGIKGRVGFEAAAPLLLIKAHHLLEKHTLGKHQLLLKDQYAQWYGHWLHEGQFLDPVMRDLEAFLQSPQRSVSGQVRILLEPKRYTLLGLESGNDLMANEFGQYGEMNTGWSGEDVRGFSKILSNAAMIYRRVNEEK